MFVTYKLGTLTRSKINIAISWF